MTSGSCPPVDPHTPPGAYFDERVYGERVRSGEPISPG